jgi:hypothetical protein
MTHPGQLENWCAGLKLAQPIEHVDGGDGIIEPPEESQWLRPFADRAVPARRVSFAFVEVGDQQMENSMPAVA